MKIIKIDATESTNSFLKKMAAETVVENLTTVIAHTQTKGRGQHHTQWHSEPFKNLTFSTFVTLNPLAVSKQAYLNFAVSLAVFKTLEHYAIPKLAIKWPNDILAGNKKLCGILIENSLKNNTIYSSVIGIGLNVNQTEFPKELSQASSMKNCMGTSFELDEVLSVLLQNITQSINQINEGKYHSLHQEYQKHLYRKNVPTAFQNQDNESFMGTIQGVNSSGLLEIMLEDDCIQTFSLKEIRMLTS